MIIIKTPSEIEKMRVLGNEASTLLQTLKTNACAGMKTADLERIAVTEANSINANLSSHGYHGYPGHLCISLNETVVHGIPGKTRLKDGDLVSIDMILDRDGVFVDTAITFTIGNPNKHQKNLMNVTKEALSKGISKAIPGNRIGDISSTIQNTVEENGFSVIREFVGHGVGKSIHEDPQIPNHGIPGTGPKIQSGMTLAIEPMVSAGGWRVKVLSDGWTANMADGSLSAHFEHTVLVTDNEPEIITKRK